MVSGVSVQVSVLGFRVQRFRVLGSEVSGFN
jgi:hypothetical protein